MSDRTSHSAFWDDLARDIEDDTEFRRGFTDESMRIAAIDAVVNTLNDARDEVDANECEETAESEDR